MSLARSHAHSCTNPQLHTLHPSLATQPNLQDANDELNAATDTQLAGVSGAYFVGSRQRSSPQVSCDKEVQRRLWQVLEKQTGASWPV